MDSIIICITAFVGEILGTVTGLGNATFFVPIMSLISSFGAAIGIIGIIHVLSNISRVGIFWKSIDWSVFFKFGLANIIFVGVGAYVTRFIPFKNIEIILGSLLAAISIYELFVKQVKFPTNVLFESCAGAITGFFGGLVGTSGPFRTLVLINIGLSKNVFVATSSAVDFIGDLLRLSIYVYNGFVTLSVIPMIPVLFVLILGGSLIGKKILRYIPQKFFNQLVACALLLLAIGLIGQAIQ